MRGLLIASAGLAVAAAATARPVYSNGPLATDPGAPGGNMWSRLQTGQNTLGAGHQGGTINNRVADDFVVTDAAGWTISNMRFFAYQTGGSSTATTFTGLNLNVWNGRPGDVGSAIVAGGAFNVALNATNSTFSGIFRVSSTATTTDRPIWANDAAMSLTLAQGTYWLDWNMTGTLASGPWAPPVTIAGQNNVPGANARQFIGTSATWNDLTDTGTLLPSAMPFEITYVLAPTPGAAALFGVAGLAGLRRRR